MLSSNCFREKIEAKNFFCSEIHVQMNHEKCFCAMMKSFVEFFAHNFPLTSKLIF